MGKRIAKRVLLIGWDAADWKMIRPLVDQGHMPTLAKLLASGASGNLATIQPVLSPMLWNSIATGKRADKHGICSFVEPMPDRSGIRPVSSTSRKCKAIWNILTQAGLRSNVISWFASHPAEPIRGSIVTDRYAARTIDSAAGRTFPEGTFYPRGLQEELAPLVVAPSDIDLEALLPFIPRTAEIDQRTDDRLARLAHLIARASTVHAAACRVIAPRDWDFTAVYYSAIDEFGHDFMPYHPPRLAGISERDAEIYHEVMTGCYRFHDMMLEALLACAGPETTIMIASDHGFHSGARRPSASAWQDPETWHREFGIACVHGPGIRRDATLYGATLLDVTPTILAMLGLPIGADMDGRPWLEVFDEPVAAEHVDSWESIAGDAGQHREELREDPAGAAEVMRRLIDLGYVEAPSADVEETIGKAVRDGKVNLAIAVTSSRRADRALELWQALAAEYPEEDGFKLQLASCLLRLGKWAACSDAIDQIEGPIRESPFVQVMLASVAVGESRIADALGIARDASEQSPRDPSLLNRLGDLFLSAKSWNEAERAFQASVAALEENPVALDGLAKVSLERDDFPAALAHAMLAVGLLHFFPAAHFHLGEALRGLGRDQESIAAFQTCLAMGYEPAKTHGRLAALLRLRSPAKANQHEALSLSL